MKIKDKEYQSFGPKELADLAYNYPNDAELGKQIRNIVNDITHVDCGTPECCGTCNEPNWTEATPT